MTDPFWGARALLDVLLIHRDDSALCTIVDDVAEGQPLVTYTRDADGTLRAADGSTIAIAELCAVCTYSRGGEQTYFGQADGSLLAPDGSRADLAELLARLSVTRAAHEASVLYRATGNGLAVWQAYAAHRARGLPVPEGILQVLDDMARRLESASGVTEVAAAVGMTSARGGPQGAAHLRAVREQREIALAVGRLQAAGKAVAEAVRVVAAGRGVSPHAVRQACRRWQSRLAPRRRVTVADTTLDVLRMLGKR